MSLELTDVWAGYVPGVDILRGLSLKASPGEIVTIIGPNGSGKSTSLKVAAGYLGARTGQVFVDGRPVGDLSVDRRVRQSGIAIVPQSDNVFGSLTVWENLDLGGTFMPAADRRRLGDGGHSACGHPQASLRSAPRSPASDRGRASRTCPTPSRAARGSGGG